MRPRRVPHAVRVAATLASASLPGARGPLYARVCWLRAVADNCIREKKQHAVEQACTHPSPRYTWLGQPLG